MDQKTQESFEHFYKCFEAEKAGKTIQRFAHQGWVDGDIKTCHHYLSPDDYVTHIRIKPEPPKLKRVLLSGEDLPSIFWVKKHTTFLGEAFLVTMITLGELTINNKTYHMSDLMIHGAEWSTDRKTWYPFYKEVEE